MIRGCGVMNKLEFYYDYICPFCYRTYRSLRTMMPDFKALNSCVRYIRAGSVPAQAAWPSAGFSCAGTMGAISLFIMT